ncbi:MAG: cupin domain-containing protein [Planctomycetota bacterium]
MSERSRRYPDFIRGEGNRVAQAPEGMSGYVFEGAGGEQVVFWENSRGGHCPPAAHDFWEYALVVEGTFTGSVGGKRVELEAGDEIVVPPGVTHDGRYSANYRAIDAFGGKRVRRIGEVEGAPGDTSTREGRGIRDRGLRWEMYRVLSSFCEYLAGSCWADGERPLPPVYREYVAREHWRSERRLMADRADRYSYVSALVLRALLARYELSETGLFPRPHDSEKGLVRIAQAFSDGVAAAQNEDGTVHLFWQDPATAKKDNWNFDTCGGATIFHSVLRTVPYVEEERKRKYVDAVRRFLGWVKDWESDGVMLVGPHGAGPGEPDYSHNPYVTCSGCVLALLADWFSATGDETHLAFARRLLEHLAKDFYREDGSCGGMSCCSAKQEKPFDMKAPDHFGDVFYIDDGVLRALQAFPEEHLPKMLRERVARHVGWLAAARVGAYWPLAGPTFEGRQHGYWINAKTMQMGGVISELDRVVDAGILTEADRQAIGRFLIDPSTIERAGLMQEPNRNCHSYEATGAAASTLAVLLGAGLYEPARAWRE